MKISTFNGSDWGLTWVRTLMWFLCQIFLFICFYFFLCFIFFVLLAVACCFSAVTSLLRVFETPCGVLIVTKLPPCRGVACFNLKIDQCDRLPMAFLATSLYRGRKSPGTAILRNQEARSATSAKRVQQDVPIAEVGQRTRLSGLDHPQQDRQPPSCYAQTRGFRSPYGT